MYTTEPADTSPFKEMKLYEGDKHVLTVRKDGVVVLVENNGHVGTLQTDGRTMTIPTGGEAKIEEDGTITLKGDELTRTSNRAGGIEGGMRRHVEALFDRLLARHFGDRTHVKRLFTDLFLRQPDGTLTTALLSEDDLRKRGIASKADEKRVLEMLGGTRP